MVNRDFAKHIKELIHKETEGKCKYFCILYNNDGEFLYCGNNENALSISGILSRVKHVMDGVPTSNSIFDGFKEC